VHEQHWQAKIANSSNIGPNRGDLSEFFQKSHGYYLQIGKGVAK